MALLTQVNLTDQICEKEIFFLVYEERSENMPALPSWTDMVSPTQQLHQATVAPENSAFADLRDLFPATQYWARIVPVSVVGPGQPSKHLFFFTAEDCKQILLRSLLVIEFPLPFSLDVHESFVSKITVYKLLFLLIYAALRSFCSS